MTATPRTQALWMKHHAFSTEEEASEALCDFRDHGNALETELAAAQAECERLKFASEGHLLKTIQQQAELARLRAELAVAENWVEHHSKHADDLIAENVKLRADLERFTGHGLLDCHAICDQRDAAVAERDRLRAELKELSQAYELNRVSIDELDADRRLAEKAEAELVAAKAECERLKNQRDNLLKPLRARAEDRADAADEKVERLTSENEKLTIERDALANGSAIELARLRAEVERLKGALALGQENCDSIYNDMREERTELTARAEKAEAALADWSLLNTWGGTPEIIHEFIKGQQNRIHHCQDLEAECLEQARLLGMSGEREADLLGKIERLAKDKARLDWLEANPEAVKASSVFKSTFGRKIWWRGAGGDYDTARAAIDAAMKGTT